MRTTNKILTVLLLLSAFVQPVSAVDKENVDETVRKEREYIKQGNKHFNDKRFADAEVEYKKALAVNPNSMIGNYNLALSLIRQSGGANVEDANNPLNDATERLKTVATGSKNAGLRSKAYYNLGNIAYNQQQYDQSIEMYKHALRQNPDDNQARENLRLAQLKKQEQEQNKDNKNENKDKKDEKQDDKEQNKDNQDKKDDNRNQQQQPKPQQDLSKDNMEQILQTMQNQEKATQEKVNAQKPQSVRRTGNQW